MAYDLVLGGDGFVGSKLVRVLASGGAHVVSVDRAAHGGGDHPMVMSRTLDLFTCGEGDLDELVGGCRTVYHLVWSSIPASAEADPARDIADNVATSVRIFKAAAKAGVRVVFSSSGGTVYGETLSPEIAEDHPCRPVSAYGAGKRAAEEYADFFRRTHALDVRIARLANPYGAGQHPARPQGAVSRFTRQALLNEVIEIWGNGEIVRDYIHVSDAVECLIQLGGLPRDQLADHHIFNVGSGHGASLNEVLETLSKVLQRPLDVTFLPGRSIDASRNVLSIARARAVLGWRPRLSLGNGIRTLVDELQAARATEVSNL